MLEQTKYSKVPFISTYGGAVFGFRHGRWNQMPFNCILMFWIDGIEKKNLQDLGGYIDLSAFLYS